MKELMIHVERAVRPVRAGIMRKLRMRRELLAHLTTIYDEEKARLGDESAALEAALCRFGDPAALTRELQETVPVVERYFNTPLPGSGDTARGIRPGSWSQQSALRWAGVYAALNVLAALPFVLARPLTPVVEVVGLTMIALTAFAFAYLCVRMCEAIAPAAGARSWLKAGGFAALAFAVQVVASVFGSVYVLADTTVLYERLPQKCIAIAFIVACFAVISFVVSRYKQSLHEWLALDISG